MRKFPCLERALRLVGVALMLSGTAKAFKSGRPEANIHSLTS